MPQDSAILPGYIPIGIHANHIDMSKFATVGDPGFVAVCGELRRWIKQLRSTAAPGTSILLAGSDAFQSNAATCTYADIAVQIGLTEISSCSISLQSRLCWALRCP